MNETRDWLEIQRACKHKDCGVLFFPGVKHQEYCFRHRHLAGLRLRPMHNARKP